MNFRSTYAGQKIFLTGHTGFKGSWLAEWLLRCEAKITGFSIDIPTQPALFEDLSLASRLEDHRGDVRDFQAVLKAMQAAQPKIIFHLAAQPIVRRSYDEPLETFATNIMGTAHVLEAARRVRSVKAVVVVTTDKVYENTEQAKPFLESDPLGGHDPYSASKAGAEIVFASYSRSFLLGSGIHAASARAGNVIGGGDWASERIVPDCVRAWTEQKKVVIRNPASVRPWQHVLEPLSGYLRLGQLLLESPEKGSGQAFNFGPNQELTRSALELVQELEKHWPGAGHEFQADESQDGKKEAAFLSLDPGKARDVLGWTPRLSFSETAQWTAEWYRSAADRDALLDITRRQIAQFEAH